jgi:hypothetical protein
MTISPVADHIGEVLYYPVQRTFLAKYDLANSVLDARLITTPEGADYTCWWTGGCPIDTFRERGNEIGQAQPRFLSLLSLTLRPSPPPSLRQVGRIVLVLSRASAAILRSRGLSYTAIPKG